MADLENVVPVFIYYKDFDIDWMKKCGSNNKEVNQINKKIIIYLL